MKIQSINTYLYKNNSFSFKKTDSKQFSRVDSPLPNFSFANSGFYTSGISFGNNINPVKDNAFYSNTPKFSQYLADKIAKNLIITTPEEVHKNVLDVMKRAHCDEKTAREVIARIVQFSNTNSLSVIEKQLKKDKVSDIRKLGDSPEYCFSLSSIFRYVAGTKKQIDLTDGRRTAIFADKQFFTYSDNINPKNDWVDYYYLRKNLNKHKSYIYLLDGYGGGDSDTYSMLGMSDSYSNIAVNIIGKMKKSGKSFDEVVNTPIQNEIKKRFGKFCPVKLIQNPKAANPTDENISEMLNPIMPDKFDIQAFIEYYANSLINNAPSKYSKYDVKKLIAEYLDATLTCYSPKSMNEALKSKYYSIDYMVRKLNKNMDDVIYLVPAGPDVKSFNLVTKQYALVNNIPPEQIKIFNICDVYTDEKKKEQYKDKVIVILDDFSGSGESITDTKFRYDDFVEHFRGSNVIFAPIVLLKRAYYCINDSIKREEREDKDFILPSKLMDYISFECQKLDDDEAEILSSVLGFGGYFESKACSVFPFSVPDNNTNLSLIFTGLFLKNMFAPNQVHVDRTYNMEPEKMLNEIKMRSNMLRNKNAG